MVTRPPNLELCGWLEYQPHQDIASPHHLHTSPNPRKYFLVIWWVAIIQPNGKIPPSGSAFRFSIFGLLVFIYSALRIWPYGVDSKNLMMARTKTLWYCSEWVVGIHMDFWWQRLKLNFTIMMSFCLEQVNIGHWLLRGAERVGVRHEIIFGKLLCTQYKCYPIPIWNKPHI